MRARSPARLSQHVRLEIPLCVRRSRMCAARTARVIDSALPPQHDEPHIVTQPSPRTSKYNPDWLAASVSGGANPLILAEWLASAMDLREGMRVLDLSCGRAASSIFLRREFGVQVWAVDLWFSASENLERIRDAQVEDGVFPIHADARSLPFAAEFFDAIVCIDAFPYYGTDDLYLASLARFVKPGGPIGIAGAGFTREIDRDVPEHLRAWWTHDLACIHSAAWWRKHWERSGIVDIDRADDMPDGWRLWLEWQKTIAPDNRVEIDALEADRGEYLGYVRMVGRRRAGVKLDEPIAAVPAQYTRKPLLHED
jgi:SAM-dependent methyltransferase